MRAAVRRCLRSGWLIAGAAALACGGPDGGGLALTIETHRAAPTGEVDLRLFAGGMSCPDPITRTRAAELVALPACTGAPGATCAVRRVTLAPGQEALFKDVPAGNVVVFVASPTGGSPDTGGCGTAAVSPGTIATATVTLAGLQ